MRIALAIHGGAGAVPRALMNSRLEGHYRDALSQALRAGYGVLREGGSSIDAVVASVVVLEDSPLFNAGRGAVFNEAGTHELDAAVMEGAALRAGAVAAIRRARNPILVARAVMEKTPHVLLVGSGADRFARKQGIEIVPPDYFSTQQRLIALERARLRQRGQLSTSATQAEQHGTVGAVALDRAGNLAAATSTGGRTNKMLGRVGDTPIVGAGTYANNETCAVSGTGDGEFFMRGVLAYDVSARMRYLRISLARACRDALAQVAALGGSGGLIAVDRAGRIAMPFNTEGMYRGYVRADGRFVVKIFHR